ncbi:hypothetical protein ACFSTC_30945 [Nonomuraea ferruginea]
MRDVQPQLADQPGGQRLPEHTSAPPTTHTSRSPAAARARATASSIPPVTNVNVAGWLDQRLPLGVGEHEHRVRERRRVTPRLQARPEHAHPHHVRARLGGELRPDLRVLRALREDPPVEPLQILVRPGGEPVDRDRHVQHHIAHAR